MTETLQRRIGLAAWGALAVLQVIWHAWLQPDRHTPLALALAIALVPLAIPLIWWRRPWLALVIAGMVALFYFCHGVAIAYSVPQERVLAWVEIVLSVIVILGNARAPRRRATRGAAPP